MNASATSLSEQAAGVGSAGWQWLVRPEPLADAWECAYENYAIFIVLFTGNHPNSLHTHTPNSLHTHTFISTHENTCLPTCTRPHTQTQPPVHSGTPHTLR